MKAIPKEDKSKQYKKTTKKTIIKTKQNKIHIYRPTLKRAHCLLSKLILNDNIQSNLTKLMGYRKKEQKQKNTYMAIQAKRQGSI